VLTDFSGTVDSMAITNQSLSWSSEDDNTVTYNFSFDYYPGPEATETSTASGTVTFNKLEGTYVFDLVDPIGGDVQYSTSTPYASFYYDTQGNNSPEIVVQQYSATADFFGVLTGKVADPPSDSTDLNAGGDHTFTPGEMFDSVSTAYVNVATATVGVDSDTIQHGELLNYDFYASNPVIGDTTDVGQDPTAYVDTTTERAYANSIEITLDQIIVGEDIAVLLKLENPTTHEETTKLLIANDAGDYVEDADGFKVVTISADDYDSATYQIYGIQVLSSTENVTGTGYSLSSSGTEEVTLTDAGKDYENTSDSDVMKIIKIDVTTKSVSHYDTDLVFNGEVIDGDQDSAGFSFNVHLEADSQILEGSASADYLNGTSGDDTMLGLAGDDILLGGLGQDTMTGGGDSDTFAFNLVDDSPVGLNDVITDFVSGTDVIDLSGIDAITGGSDDAFTYIDADPFSGAAGELHFDPATHMLEGDVNGDGAADFQVELTGVATIAEATDLIL